MNNDDLKSEQAGQTYVSENQVPDSSSHSLLGYFNKRNKTIGFVVIILILIVVFILKNTIFLSISDSMTDSFSNTSVEIGDNEFIVEDTLEYENESQAGNQTIDPMHLEYEKQGIMKNGVFVTSDLDGDSLPDWLEQKIGTNAQAPQCKELVANCGQIGDVNSSGDRQYIIMILDTSGSMNAAVGSQNRLEAAKTAIMDYVSRFENSTVNLGLIIYGHVGNNSTAKKAESCAGIDTIYSPAQLDKATFAQAITPLQPTGWTPIAESLKKAKEELLKIPDATTKNSAIILVTDGEESCGGNPVAVAKEIKESGLQVVVDVVALGTDEAANSKLRPIAEAGGGAFLSVKDTKEAYNEMWSTYLKEVTQKHSRIAVCSAHTNVDLSNCLTENNQKIYDYLNTIPVEQKQLREQILSFSSKNDIMDNFSNYITSLMEIINKNAQKATEDADQQRKNVQ